MRKNCLSCHNVGVKCRSAGDGTPCARCIKNHLTCVFLPSLHAKVCLPPPQTLPPPPTIPKWTHKFIANVNSSNRVKAAAVAFLANSSDNFISKSRLLDRTKKKEAKQEKFLRLVDEIIGRTSWLTTDDIKKDVVVFDGTASHPPPPINPPQCE